MSTVLLTGARGFIGARVVERLLSAGHEVHGVCSTGAREHDARVIWHEADLLSASAVAALAQQARASELLHLAWYATPGLFWSALENTEWISATLRLVRAFAEAGGRRAVIAGTCAEYAWGEEVLRERHTALSPATLYGACKHATHVAATVLARELGISMAWARVFFLYGPGEDPRRLVASVARSLVRGERVATTQGEQLRDFMHVDDVAGAFAALLASHVQGPVNVASGEPVAVRAVVEAIGRATGGLGNVDFGALQARPGDPHRIVADTGRLREEVGFTPGMKLSEGIASCVEYWRRQEIGERVA